MASDTSSGLYDSILDHSNGLYACLRTLINDSELIYVCFVKSAVEVAFVWMLNVTGQSGCRDRHVGSDVCGTREARCEWLVMCVACVV